MKWVKDWLNKPLDEEDSFKIFIWFICIAAIFITIAVVYSSPNKNNDLYEIMIRIDKETGCQYLRTSSSGVLTPRMGKDGKQICE